MKNLFYIAILATVFFASCSDDDPVSNEFTVTIENAFQANSFFSNGSFGAIPPGESTSITFNAGQGHYLQFATMFVQSNDLFLAPDDSGIPLYNSDGTALAGDVTSMIDFWDAGTEVNEIPGEGPNQAPRQAAANTGDDENGIVVLLDDVNDGFTYPAVSEVISASLAHDGGTQFTLTIENPSASSALPSPLAPGVWAIHDAGLYPVFEEGVAAANGLEGLAEDGDNVMTSDYLDANAGLVSPFAPGAYAVGTSNSVFNTGEISTAALEALAEDGDPSGFDKPFNTPVGASAAGPIFPGDSYSFTFSAEEGDHLSAALMLVQSNDWFIGLNNIALYSGAGPISGDITGMAALYDSGTEVDEYPGAGATQAPRQSGPNVGATQNESVSSVSTPRDNVPSVAGMIKITIQPN